jgi:hypothetical protein
MAVLEAENLNFLHPSKPLSPQPARCSLFSRRQQIADSIFSILAMKQVLLSPDLLSAQHP